MTFAQQQKSSNGTQISTTPECAMESGRVHQAIGLGIVVGAGVGILEMLLGGLLAGIGEGYVIALCVDQ